MDAERPPFRSDLEGLRGLAIVLVVGFHAGVSQLAGGFVGVDVFFVLSGFLITGMLAREAVSTGDVDLSGFYARRARRLLPALLVVLVATLGIVLWLYAPIDRAAIATDARAVALHYGNMAFASNAVDYHSTADNPFLHTWSLAVEEQFYIVWPLLFALVARSSDRGEATRRRLVIGVIVAGAASFAASVWATRVAQPWAFFGMPTRIWEFALGGIIALVPPPESTKSAPVGTTLQIAGLIGLGAAVWLLNETTPYPGYAAMLPAASAGALLIGGRRAPESGVSRVLSAPALRWFGRVSYSWYLWHWPLVGLGAVLDWRIGVAGRLAWSAVALVLAVLTLRYVEEPVRRGELFGERSDSWINLAALGATAAAALLTVAALGAARSSTASPIQRRIAAARQDAMSHDCWGSLLENAKGKCEFGDLRASTSAVLLGDSHAEHWLAGMDRVGAARGWKVTAMIKPGCPVADVPQLMNTRLKRYYTECTEWRRSMLRRIIAMHPSFVVLSSFDHYVSPSDPGKEWKLTPAQWRAGLRRTYVALNNAGIDVVVIRGTPRTGFDVPSCLSRLASRAPFGASSCTYERATGVVPSAVAAQNEAARGLRRVAFIDLNDRVCATDVCSVVQRGTIVFRDDNHLTAAFSRREAPVLGERIERALSSLRR